MSDDEDAVDTTRKSSRRDRFKGAIARTKTKLAKKEKDGGTTVDDFLGTARSSISTGRPSVSDSLSLISDRPPTNQSHYQDAHETQHEEPVQAPLPSPRRIVVPKIDVSTSQRYPGAQPLQQDGDHTEPSLLRPNYQARNQSSSSLSKGRGRARGLSVQFVDRPPIIIGEGGDEAEAPPIEVGRAKARARSASPMRTPGSVPGGAKTWHNSPVRQAPRAAEWPTKQPPSPSQTFNTISTTAPPAQGALQPPGLHRVQTGMPGSPSPLLDSRQAIDKEFEMSLRPSPTATPTSNTASPIDPPMIHAPKPIRPPAAYPDVREMPVLHELKLQYGTKTLRNRFETGEGRALRQRMASDAERSPARGVSDEKFAPPPGPPPGRRPPDEEFAPPPGPPPPNTQASSGRQPPDEEFAPPAGPPLSNNQGPNGYQPHPVRASGSDGSRFYSAAGPQSGRQVSNGTHAPREYATLRKDLPTRDKAPPSAKAADDDYVGWVPDGTQQTTNTQAAPHQFPGVDTSGKLAAFPGVDEDEETKPEKSKRRWFRRGS